MERLTFEGNFCDIAQCRELPCPYHGSCSQREVWERLKSYEDTGWEPQQITKTKDALEYAYGNADRIIELAEADKDGRVVVLPVKPVLTPVTSSMLYVIENGEICEDTLYEAVVGMSSSGETNVIYTTLSDQIIFEQADIGETVFFTREEAEKALNERKTDNG